MSSFSRFHAVFGILTTLLLQAGLTLPAFAQEVHRFDINTTDAATAIHEFGSQADVQILVAAEALNGKHLNKVHGNLSTADALIKLLADTGLSHQYVGDRAVAVLPEPARPASDSASVLVPNPRRADNPRAPDVRAAKKSSLGRFRLAQAETSDNPQTTKSPEKPEGVLEGIVVTARKRPESIQSVAMSVTALSQQEIERRDLVGMGDYLRTLPGVNQLDRGVGRNSIVMRGVSASPQGESISVSPTVGIYFADVPLTGYTVRGDSADIKLVDIERIEVLRGPQGTLYGSSSLSGAVRNIPVAPDLSRFTGNIAMEYSHTDGNGDDNNSIEGVLNVPLVKDRLALRAVAYDINNSGYVTNIAGSVPEFRQVAADFGAPQLAVNQDNIGNNEYTGGRISALWRPIENLNATLTYIKQELKQEGFPEVQLDLAPERFAQTRLQIADVAGGGSEILEDDIEVLSLDLDYDLGWATLLSATSWVDQTTNENRDIETFLRGIPSPQVNIGESNAFTQEVRIATQFQGPFQFLAGLYYEDIETDRLHLTYFGGDPSLNPFGDEDDLLLFSIGPDRDLRQRAAFAELSYELFAGLQVTVGTRYFSYERVDVSHNGGVLFFESSETLSVEDSDFTSKFNLTYTPTDDVLIYTTWAEGFRLGRAAGPLPPTCDVDGDGFIDGSNNVSAFGYSIEPDNLESYELGGKVTALQGRLVVNTAVYYNEWQGIPVSVNTAPCGLVYTVNAGEARTRGIELEAVLYASQALRFTFGGSYVDAELTKDAPLIGLAGDRLPGSPKFNVNAGFQFDFTLANHAGYARADYAYVGGFYNNLQETGTEAGDYPELNLSAGMSFDQVAVELFIHNLTNSDALTWVETEFLGFDTRAYRLRPRTIGVNLRFEF